MADTTAETCLTFPFERALWRRLLASASLLLMMEVCSGPMRANLLMGGLPCCLLGAATHHARDATIAMHPATLALRANSAYSAFRHSTERLDTVLRTSELFLHDVT